MKYLLTLFLIIILSNCGGSGSKNHNFKVTVIDGYLAESNISFYDKDNKKLAITKNTDSKGSFSYRDTKNDLFYIKAVSGIDIMSDEVFNSVLYGVAPKGTSVIVSPLSSIVWAYNKSDKSIDYKKRAKDIQDKLGLTKNILTFDPISNISNKESSKIIQFNVTLEAISRLINSSLGGSFEYIFYSSAYEALINNGYEDMNFLYSDSFIDALSSKLYRKYEYLNISVVDLKLAFLQKSIAYIVDELSYFEANNKDLLKRNYKASLILTNPIIKEASLMQNIITKDTDYVSEYFNEINSKIHSLKIYEIIKGLKIVGGFRGMLYKISDINRDTKSIKPSFFSDSFLNKELLLKSSIIYDKLSKSISSGAPSQDEFKDNLIKNTIFINMENKEILDSRAINQIQDQVSLSFKFTTVNSVAINPNAELLVRKKEIEANKKSFGRTIEKLRDDIQKSENNAITISKIDTDIINKHNTESLIISQSSIYKKNELQNNNILKQTRAYQLVLFRASQGANIIKTSLSLELTKAKEELIKEEINKIALAKKIADYKTKLLTTDDEKIKDKITKDLKKSETLQKTSTSAISELTKKIDTQAKKITSTNKILKGKPSQYENLLETHIILQKEEERQQDNFLKVKKAKNIYDNKLIEIENKLHEQQKEYEKDLIALSIGITNGSPNLTLVNKLRSELKAILTLENQLEHIVVTKNDLANEISFKVHNLKTCYDRDENNLFSITIDQNNSFVEVEISNIPENTIFNESNYSLIRKTSDGINPFYMPTKDYNVSIDVSNTDTDKKESKELHFKVKNNCSDNTSFAFKAPLQIPNIPNLDAPELNTSKELPNPNDGKNPPPIDNTPPEDN